MVVARFVSGYCLHLVIDVVMLRVIPPSLLPFVAHLVSLGFGVSTSVHLCCLAVVRILSNASLMGMVMWKQRVREGEGGFQPPAGDSSVPRSSRPSQVAEAIGSFRIWFLFLVLAEHPEANSAAHRMRAVMVMTALCFIVSSRLI